MTYVPDEKRYDGASFNRCGRSGIVLPPISLGLWQNFGGVNVFETGRSVIRRAFDRGVTHFDLANNYGPPYGSAEENFGEILRKDFSGHRNELLISTKAGWDMWPGPYGLGGSRKYMLASLNESLSRMGLEYVDIFYSHRPTADVPLEETMGALVQAVRQGKALYVGISSYGPERTREAARILKSEGVPLLIHQPSYSMLNRWVEKELLGTLDELGVGCIAFSPLAQGLLTDKYLNGVPAEFPCQVRGVVRQRIPECGKPQASEGTQRDRQGTWTVSGSDGDRVGLARQEGDLRADRSAQRRAVGQFARCNEKASVHGCGTERD